MQAPPPSIATFPEKLLLMIFVFGAPQIALPPKLKEPGPVVTFPKKLQFAMRQMEALYMPPP
jgi:hypothetical protein